MIDRDIFAYIVITYVIGYILQIYLELGNITNEFRILFLLFIAFIPGLVAFLFNFIQPELPFSMNFKNWILSVKYYLFAIFIPLGFGGITHLLVLKNPKIYLLNLSFLPFYLVPAFFELLGWWGYLQRILVDYDSILRVSILVGLVWSGYHAPTYLSEFSGIAVLIFLMTTLIIIGISMIFSYLLIDTSSIPLIALFYSFHLLIFSLFNNPDVSDFQYTVNDFLIRFIYGLVFLIIGLFLVDQLEDQEFAY